MIYRQEKIDRRFKRVLHAIHNPAFYDNPQHEERCRTRFLLWSRHNAIRDQCGNIRCCVDTAHCWRVACIDGDLSCADYYALNE